MNKYTVYTKDICTKRGQIVILNVLVFVAISLFIMYVVLHPLSSSNESLRLLRDSKLVDTVTESAIDEVLYRLNRGLVVPEVFELTLASTSVDIEIVGIGTSTERSITVSSVQGSMVVNVAQYASTTSWLIVGWGE